MTTLKVSETDVSQIKENLKTFLNNQSEFTDYDFDASGLSVILDILAYNTHYNAVHTNLSHSEAYLDSAVKRSNVVSRAKEVGYLPRSKRAANAVINVSFSVTGNPNEYILPKNTKFSASAGGNTYTFVTTEDILIENNGADIFTANINIYQGAFIDYQYTIDLNNSVQRTIVPSVDVDTRFLSVLQKDSSSEVDFNVYKFIDNIFLGELASDTQVYFMSETYDGYFEVYFGDDVLGKAIETNNIVKLNYLITDGSDANGASSFTLASAITDISSLSITTVSAATGGADKESIDSIKYLAPFYYQSQKRAVTTDDYKALIVNTFTNIDDVQVWGGEDNDPPYYGRVFAALKPVTNTYLSVASKQQIQNEITNKYNILTVTPQIVDPDYIDVSIATTVTYNSRILDTTSTALQTQIKTAIQNFFSNAVNKFGKPLYFSKLVSTIDNASDVIINSVTNLTLAKRLEIFQSISAEYSYQFNNAITPGSVRSNAFVIGGVTYKIIDLPSGTSPYTTGTIGVYRTSDGVYLSQSKGTVNYNTGSVVIENLAIDSIVDDPINKELVITLTPGSVVDVSDTETIFTDYNVYTNERDQIIKLATNGISVTLIADENA